MASNATGMALLASALLKAWTALSVVSGLGCVAHAAGVHATRNKTDLIHTVVQRQMHSDGVFGDSLTPQYRPFQARRSPSGWTKSKLKGYTGRIRAHISVACPYPLLREDIFPVARRLFLAEYIAASAALSKLSDVVPSMG